MRKNFLFGMFAAATMLFATSCQKEELGTETTVTFALTQPGIATKAYSDGETATTLTYAVYEAGTQTPVEVSEDQITFSGLTATVNLRLVTGKTYDIIFWADAAASPYTFNRTAQTITVDYDGVKSQDENRDAFYTVRKNLYVDGAINENITLKRPFAQLNIGTTDFAAEAVVADAPEKSEVTVSNVYSTLNLFDGTVAGEREMTFAMANIPTGETFPVAGVDYLSMNYLLVAAESELVEIDFTVENASGHQVTRTFSNVPVQRNYRTNIYGKLLTSPADFTITINPAYETPNNDVVIWDGTSVSQPNSTNTEWIVSTAAEWVWLKQNGVQGKNIKLAANIDFGGYAVKGLGFTGTFDGQGYTMSNMTLLCGGSYYSNGLFQGDASGNVTVQNVTIKNVTAECANPDQGYVGTIFGDVQNGTVILNGVNVVNTNLCGVQSVGGLVGFVGSGATLNITDCTVDGSAISNYPVVNESGFVAGLVGRPVGTVNVTNSTVTNTTIDAYYAPRRGEASIQPVVGDNATLTAGSDVVVTKTSLENVVFVQNAEDLGTVNIETGAVVILPEGAFNIPGSVNGKVVTFVGSGDANKTVINPHGGFHGATLTFKNVTLAVAANASYTGSQHIAGATYKNCIIEGQIFLYATSTFENCTFNNTGDNYNVWTYGTNPTFTGCTFNCDGKAVLVYTENNTIDDVVTFNNCTFNDNGSISGKAAIETAANAATVQHTLNINNCTVNGFDVTGQSGNGFGGTDLGTNVWGNKNLMTTDNLDVFIDGTEVY